MKKVLILGSGMVARPLIRYLLEKNYHVTVASNTPDRTEQMIAGHPRGVPVTWEASDEGALDALVASHDLTVSLLPYSFHLMVARRCLAHRKHMVTTSYVKPEMKALDPAAREAGIILLNEIGLDPGIDHMSAMRIIDRIQGNGGAVLEFYSLCGALPAPEAADNPFRYKFSWSPRGVILAGNNDATYLKHGKVVNLPTADLFRDPFRVDFPGAGVLEVYPNRDSLSYREIYHIPETQTLYRGTFRYPGWCETLQVMKQLRLISPEPFDMTGMSYADIILHQLAPVDGKVAAGRHPASGIRNMVAEKLNIDESDHALTALDWLGYFSDTPAGRPVDSTFEVTADLMFARMMLDPGERDMVALQHAFVAGYSDGHREVIRSRMLDFGTPHGDTSIARTVALPAAIGAEMILEGEITVTGVHIPVIPEIYNPVLDRLDHMDIRMHEEFGLPYSENYL